METAIRLKFNLVVLILENTAYGMTSSKQAVDGFPEGRMPFQYPNYSNNRLHTAPLRGA